MNDYRIFDNIQLKTALSSPSVSHSPIIHSHLSFVTVKFKILIQVIGGSGAENKTKKKIT